MDCWTQGKQASSSSSSPSMTRLDTPTTLPWTCLSLKNCLCNLDQGHLARKKRLASLRFRLGSLSQRRNSDLERANSSTNCTSLFNMATQLFPFCSGMTQPSAGRRELFSLALDCFSISPYQLASSMREQ